MSNLIVGFSGRKAAGKSTAAGYLVKKGFTRLSFADPLKGMVWLLLLELGIDPAEVALRMNQGKEEIIPGINKSTRELMQTLGTEWGRELVHADLWVMAAKKRIDTIKADYLVFDDVRFESEAAMIRAAGGYIIQIVREDVAMDSHISEAGIVHHPGDLVIVNDGPLAGFLADVDAVVASFINAPGIWSWQQ